MFTQESKQKDSPPSVTLLSSTGPRRRNHSPGLIRARPWLHFLPSPRTQDVEDDLDGHPGQKLKHKSFFEDVGASTQEDFDSVTSVVADIVKMTDPKLNLVLAEGGGEPGKNRFKQTNDINPFLLSARY